MAFEIGRTYQPYASRERVVVFEIKGDAVYAQSLSNPGQVDVLSMERSTVYICDSFDETAEGIIALMDAGRLPLEKVRAMSSNDFGVTIFRQTAEQFVNVVKSFHSNPVRK